MSEREDSKIMWITCPECGAKVGIILSVGKKMLPTSASQEPTTTWPPTSISERLAAVGVDLALIDVEEDEEVISISPKKFLGDLWGPINDAVRSIGGWWIRDGRSSRWEIRKEDLT